MFLLLLGLIAFLIYFYFKRKFSFWANHGFPFVPGKIPFGSIGEMRVEAHSSDVLKKHYDEHKGKGPGFGLYMLTSPIFVPTELEVIKDIYVRNFESFHDRGFFLNEKDDPLSGNLFFKSGHDWKDLRAKLSPTFTSGKIKMMFGLVLSMSDRLIDFLKPTADGSDSIEIKEILSAFTTEVITNVAFGVDTQCLGNPNNDFRKAARTITDPPIRESLKAMVMNTFRSLSAWLGLSYNTKETNDFFRGMIENSVKHRETNHVQRNDFLQLLLQIKHSESGMTLNEIAANSFIFFLAGFETSSSSISFALYELALNENIQERLRNEIETVLSKYDGEITYDGVMEMKYLDMVFNETLRKFPINDLHFRKCTKEFQIPNSDLTIPLGTAVFISVHALHRDERFFENPDVFDPERFSNENVKKIRPYSYIPFGEGPRICIGSRFGIMQTKVALVKLLRHFKFSLCKKTTIPMEFVPSAILQSPVGGMWLKVENVD